MKSIHIRDVDPVVLAKIEILARRHHRSVQGELRFILEEASRKVPADEAAETAPPYTVSNSEGVSWSRDDWYSDEGR